MNHWVHHEHGWNHRPWWKVAINTVLRLLQPWVRRKWVIYTRTSQWIPVSIEGGRFSSAGPPDHPKVLGYGFGRIDHGGAR